MAKKVTTEDFIKKSREINGDFYDYTKTVYTGSRNNVIITCPIHGDFIQKASNHISKHYGCPKCGINRRADKRKLSIEEFIDRASKIHNNKYDYSKVAFDNMHQKVCIICPKHGEFWQTPAKHILREQGCPICQQSHGEEKIATYLTNCNIKYVYQYKVDIHGHIRIIDFYLPEYNTFIEYNGIQHYTDIPYFYNGGKITFEEQLSRDANVREYCKCSNIQLVEIKYDENVNEVLDKWKQLIQPQVM